MRVARIGRVGRYARGICPGRGLRLNIHLNSPAILGKRGQVSRAAHICDGIKRHGSLEHCALLAGKLLA